MFRPEVMAPAGDEASLRAAVQAGADAVYFGLSGFNARARATNFDAGALAGVIDELHAHGVKGYVTLNTLVFDQELPAVENAIRACASAGADAIIVQDLGVAAIARAMAPSLPIHASTQMTCTDAASVALAASLGASRVVLARELSVAEIGEIRAKTSVELEVFVHGALCVSYSGQCLTSEAIGGRSANRGACAQACRLPYALIVDGVEKDLGERAYLLSPEDLEAASLVPALVELGVHGLKIEGRLKGPEYVAATTRLYRAAVDACFGEPRPNDDLRRAALLTYSRGSGPGFLAGVDHQRLVEARTCEHRGVQVGLVSRLEHARGRTWLVLGGSTEPLARGDGLMIEGGLAGEGEMGGRIWDIEGARIWLGPDRDVPEVVVGRRVFKNDDPAVEKQVLSAIERDPHRTPIALAIAGELGAPFTLTARSARGHEATVIGDAPIERAAGRAIDEVILRDKLGRLGGTPFALGTLEVGIPDGAMIPVSALNRARRELVEGLSASLRRRFEVGEVPGFAIPGRAPPPRGLFVLCRNLAQAEAAIAAGADGVYLDFLELTGVSRAVEALRANGAAFVGVAPPRIRKPGEEQIDRHLADLDPDAILIRGLGALHELATSARTERPLRIGDFSLNITNRPSASVVLGMGLDAFTPAFDLDAAQLEGLLSTDAGRYVELVIHHPMPLFHTEHCVFAALLSNGADYRTCGRPCEHHHLELRDRAGLAHPVEADVGCRNTIFHARSQSAAGQVAAARASGVPRYRIELVRESPSDTSRIVGAYRSLIAAELGAADLFRTLKTEQGYGVVRGSLRVL